MPLELDIRYLAFLAALTTGLVELAKQHAAVRDRPYVWKPLAVALSLLLGVPAMALFPPELEAGRAMWAFWLLHGLAGGLVAMGLYSAAGKRLAGLLGLVENLRCGVTSVIQHHKITTSPEHTDAAAEAASDDGDPGSVHRCRPFCCTASATPVSRSNRHLNARPTGTGGRPLKMRTRSRQVSRPA